MFEEYCVEFKKNLQKKDFNFDILFYCKIEWLLKSVLDKYKTHIITFSKNNINQIENNDNEAWNL